MEKVLLDFCTTKLLVIFSIVIVHLSLNALKGYIFTLTKEGGFETGGTEKNKGNKIYV